MAGNVQTKEYRGVGFKNMICWNKAIMAKHVWAIGEKKDALWIKWVHGHYIRGRDWWTYKPSIYAGIGER